MRLFVAKESKTLRQGLAGMNFTFFWTQLSTMIAGWTARYALRNESFLTLATNQQSIFGHLALKLKNASAFGDFAGSLLVLAAFGAMVSTADSGLLAFSTMFVRDIYQPYVQRVFPKAKVDAATLKLVGSLASMCAPPLVWDSPSSTSAKANPTSPVCFPSRPSPRFTPSPPCGGAYTSTGSRRKPSWPVSSPVSSPHEHGLGHRLQRQA